MNAKAKGTRTIIAASGYSNRQAPIGKSDAGRWSGEGGGMKIGNRVSRKDAPGIVGTGLRIWKQKSGVSGGNSAIVRCNGAHAGPTTYLIEERKP